jgi:hypothetical protein
MFSPEKHLDNLVRHKELIKDAAILLGKRLMEQGRPELGRAIVARGFEHDNSKFSGIEWQYLHAGNDVPKDVLATAVAQHQCTNQHHPEYFGGLAQMDEISVAEMCCDWYARAQEFGTSLREWAKTAANGKYKIDECPIQKDWIEKFINILLEDAFVRE